MSAATAKARRGSWSRRRTWEELRRTFSRDMGCLQLPPSLVRGARLALVGGRKFWSVGSERPVTRGQRRPSELARLTAEDLELTPSFI